MCSCLKRGEAPSTPGFDDVFDVFDVVGDLVGGVTGPIEAAFLLSSVSWVLDTKDWAVRERAAREEPKEEAEVGGRGTVRLGYYRLFRRISLCFLPFTITGTSESGIKETYWLC